MLLAKACRNLVERFFQFPSRSLSRTALVASLVLSIFSTGARGFSISGWPSPRWQQANREALRRFNEGRLDLAASLYQDSAAIALSSGDSASAGRLLNGLGMTQMALLKYTDADATLRQAESLALSSADYEQAAAIEGNLSSLYLQTLALREALAEAAIARERLVSYPNSVYKPNIALLYGLLLAESGSLADALEAYRTGIEGARAFGNRPLEARGWNYFGDACLRGSDFACAERCFSEAFRLATLDKSPEVVFSYARLAQLKLAQRNLLSAELFVNKAVSRLGSLARSYPPHLLYLCRSKIYLCQGRYSESFADARRALQFARRWRLEVLPAESFRAGGDATLGELYDAFYEAGAAAFLQTKDPKIAAELFEVIEEGRDASLREGLKNHRRWREKLPPEYWELLAQSRQAEAHLCSQPSPAAIREADRLRNALSDLEVRIGLTLPLPANKQENISPSISLSHVKESLRDSEALFSFHLGPLRASVWSISSSRFVYHDLGPSAPLAEACRRFSVAVQKGNPDQTLARDLYERLLGPLPDDLLHKPSWLFALDDVLFDVPLPALRDRNNAFVVESHTIRVVPNMTAVRLPDLSASSAPLVAFGDPVCNRADSRWCGRKRWILSSSDSGLAAEMPRLRGTAAEIRRVAHVWTAASGHAQIVEGEALHHGRAREALSSSPAIFHFATHFVTSQEADPRPLILLGVQSSGEMDALTADEIAAADIPGSLAVLSGCGSGSGRVLPVAGLMGLNRAWLLGGGSAVVSSRWNVPDEPGEFFGPFYEELARSHDVAAALATAQTRMIHSGTWRSAPRFWAAYVLFGGRN